MIWREERMKARGALRLLKLILFTALLGVSAAHAQQFTANQITRTPLVAYRATSVPDELTSSNILSPSYRKFTVPAGPLIEVMLPNPSAS